MVAHSIKQLPKNDEIGQIIQNFFINPYCKKFILVGEEETCMPVYYEKYADAINNFEVRESDIFVCTYPKVGEYHAEGTTWTQEMVWLIMNDLDYDGAKETLYRRFPFLDLSIMRDMEKTQAAMNGQCPDFMSDSVNYVKNMKDPRFVKTHLPFYMLPEQLKNGTKSPKIIYVIRDPRDVCVSFYHHGKLLQGWHPNIDDFCEVFMANKVTYGSFWKHVFGFWEQRNLPNILFITYEDMKKDLASVVNTVATFLGKTLTIQQTLVLCNHLSFNSMKANNAVNGTAVLKARREKKLAPEEGDFLRCGTVGKYREELSPKMIEKLNAWVTETVLGTSFSEKYNYIVQ